MRRAYFDNAKAILIFLVVFGHLVDLICTSSSGHLLKWIFLCIWSFHIPAFLFLAGVMDHPREGFPWARVLRLVCLGFVLKLCNLVVLALYPEAAAEASLLSDRYFPWYVFVLAFFTAAVHLLQRAADGLCTGGGTVVFWTAVFVVSIGISLCVGYVKAIGDFLYLSRSFVFFPFYLAGYLLSPDRVERVTEKKGLVGVVGLVGVFALFYGRLDVFYHLRPLFTGRNAYSDWGLEHGGFWLRVAAYLLSLLITFFFLCVVPRRNSRLSEVGRESLSVYCWHYYVIYALDGLGVIGILADERLRITLPVFALIALAEVMLLSHRPFTLPLHWLMKRR